VSSESVWLPHRFRCALGRIESDHRGHSVDISRTHTHTHTHTPSPGGFANTPGFDSEGKALSIKQAFWGKPTPHLVAFHLA
jgi:hypothetical protein